MSALSQTQPFSASSTINPPQETAGLISQSGGTSKKMCLRKVRNTAQREEEGTKRVTKNRGNTNVREGEGGVPWWSFYLLQPEEELCWQSWIFLKEL